MVSGKVTRQHASIPVTFRLDNQPDVSIEFVVDTGFVGYLTLPADAVAALGLPYQFDLNANLADDSNVSLAVHSATVVWHDAVVTVQVLATGKRPLLGMLLLDGSELVIQCAEDGIVTVDPL